MIEQNCKTCIHEYACDAWVRHGTTLYDDYDYSVENCPYYAESLRPKGRWIEKVGRAMCSACANECWADSVMEYNYCPNCGAKMEG